MAEEQKKNDPFVEFERIVLQPNEEVDEVISKEELDEIRKQSHEKVVAAQKFALESPVPDPEEYLDDVYDVR